MPSNAIACVPSYDRDALGRLMTLVIYNNGTYGTFLNDELGEV